MLHVPASLEEWTVFFTGLLIIAYHIHGIDGPRAWVEYIERRFSSLNYLRYSGSIMLVAGIIIAYYGNLYNTIIGALFVMGVFVICVIGFTLLVSPNHIRHLIIATAELDDKWIRISSIILVLLGLLWALAPWWFTVQP